MKTVIVSELTTEQFQALNQALIAIKFDFNNAKSDFRATKVTFTINEKDIFALYVAIGQANITAYQMLTL